MQQELTKVIQPTGKAGLCGPLKSAIDRYERNEIKLDLAVQIVPVPFGEQVGWPIEHLDEEQAAAVLADPHIHDCKAKNLIVAWAKKKQFAFTLAPPKESPKEAAKK